MIAATILSPGGRMFGCYMQRSDTRLVTPTNGGSNTSSTATLTALPLDPLHRKTLTTFYLDRLQTFNTPDLQTSSQVQSVGGRTASWASTTLANFTWYWRARSTATIGSGIGVVGPYTGAFSFAQQGGAGITRSLYLYENPKMQAVVAGVGTNARGLYLYYNPTIQAISVLARALYVYVNPTIQAQSIAGRSLYLYESPLDGEVFPWLNHLYPEEQYELGQVNLYGDGFGEYIDCTLEATITVDSVNNGYVAGNAVDRSAGSWVSNSDQSGAWIRFTFPGTKRITHIALESAGNGWGVPEFRFSDGLGNVSGGVAVPGGRNYGASNLYYCGTTRLLYTLPTPRDTTYVEIRVSGGGGATFIGLYEVWLFERKVPATAAETSRAVLNLGLVTELNMGVVSWQTRSPNFYPANSGVPPDPAAVVTVPSGAVSGLVYVEESS